VPVRYFAANRFRQPDAFLIQVNGEYPHHVEDKELLIGRPLRVRDNVSER
jgi:hypothetical protein